MTLNAIIAFILRFLRNSTDFQADYMTVVEDRPMMSVKYCLPVPVYCFWRKLLRTLQRGLSAIAEHLVYISHIRHLAHLALGNFSLKWGHIS